MTPETLRALDQDAFVILPALLVAEQFGPMCDSLHRHGAEISQGPLARFA